ncbi:MAG: MerR family DNA-binding protein [Marmoricola sp.]
MSADRSFRRSGTSRGAGPNRAEPALPDSAPGPGLTGGLSPPAGAPLDEVAEILRLRERGEPPCGYVRDVLNHQLRSVDKRIAELRALRSELRELREAADAIPEVDGATCRIIDHVKAATTVAARPPGR